MAVIPRLDAKLLGARDPQTLALLRDAAMGTGFFTIHNTDLTPARLQDILAQYRSFFQLPVREKAVIDMALLRGTYYPARPPWATACDFGCLTLLTTDGGPGMEVRKRGCRWIPISAPPGEFVINFGETMEIWTNGLVRATPHRVIGTDQERISIPMFFNPSYDTNIAPRGSGQIMQAGDHLSRRFSETYAHLEA